MPAQHCDALVVGAGVVGLTTAICLAENGLDVEVRTAALPNDTTSAVAGAIWGPFLADDPRVNPWCFTTLEVLDKLAEIPGTGVDLVSGLEATKDEVVFPHWFDEMPEARRATRVELPTGYIAGYRYRAPVVDMPVYLGYLVRRLKSAGGRIVMGEVSNLADVAADASVVVNCTGLRSRELVPDDSMTGFYGQLVVVDNPGIDEFFVEFGEDPIQTYLLPQGDKVVLGGTVETEVPGITLDPQIAREIRKRCAAVVPELGTAEVRDHRGALRPCRPTVRLELTEVDGSPVVHNYGHGGSGVSLSWACGFDVRKLILSVI